ncbi:MAG: cohesin domain-containing protein [Acutalibacteraceae bacterium]|nr:cohesin domain-containing protein [Acutalibacteraceae bacterium]
MKRKIIRLIACLCTVLIMCLSFSVGAHAEQVSKGESIALCIYIGGISDMASYSAVVTYDPSVLKSTDKKIPNGTSSYRFDPAGKISLAVIYDAIEGMDFTDYTLVCTLTFEALTNIEDTADLFSCEITEAINTSFETVDGKCIAASCVVLSDGEPAEKVQLPIENEINIDRSALAENAKHDEPIQKPEKKTKTDKEKEIISESSAPVISSTPSHAEFDSDTHPAIRFDTSTPNNNNVRHKSMVFFCLGAGFFIVAIVGAVLISVKNKE